MAWARMVAVVVPSPATSLVRLATSRTIWAPMFWNLSSSSISLATVTPSLVTTGEPKLFSMITLRPLGPRVTLTASASALTPSRIDFLATSSYCRIFAPIYSILLVSRLLFLDDSQHVFFPHDEVLGAVDFDFVACVLAEKDPVALLDVHGDDLPVLGQSALARCHDFAFGGLVLCGVGDDDPPFSLFLFL